MTNTTARYSFVRSDRDSIARQLEDGCCHRTRIKGAACPLGLACPFDQMEANDAKPLEKHE